jgi:ribosomal protein L21E
VTPRETLVSLRRDGSAPVVTTVLRETKTGDALLIEVQGSEPRWIPREWEVRS